MYIYFLNGQNINGVRKRGTTSCVHYIYNEGIEIYLKRDIISTIKSMGLVPIEHWTTEAFRLK